MHTLYHAKQKLHKLVSELIKAQRKLGLPLHSRKPLSGLSEAEVRGYAAKVTEEVAALTIQLTKDIVLDDGVEVSYKEALVITLNQASRLLYRSLH